MKIYALALALLVSSASAQSLQFSGFSFESNPAVSSYVVNIKVPGVNLEAYAGAYETSLNGGPSFNSYCIDVYKELSFGSASHPYTSALGVSPISAGTPNTGVIDTNLQKLFYVAGNPTNNLQAAALQVAIWETEYSAPGDSFTTTADVSNLANTYLTEAKTTTGSQALTYYTSTTVQDVVTIQTNQIVRPPVPEPSTFVLLLLGMGVLLGFRRRQG